MNQNNSKSKPVPREPKVGTRGPKSQAPDKDTWNKMAESYKDSQSVRSVMEGSGCGRRVARRAILEGWPDEGLPALCTLVVDKQTAVLAEVAKQRAKMQALTAPVSFMEEEAQGEATRQAAEEALAARVCLDASLKAAKLAQLAASELLRRLENGEAPLPPEITPKVILQVLKAIETASAVTKNAMQIQQMQAGKPEDLLGVEIGMLLNRCSDDELTVMRMDGFLPDRILDQRYTRIEIDTTAEENVARGINTEQEDTPESGKGGETKDIIDIPDVNYSEENIGDYAESASLDEGNP